MSVTQLNVQSGLWQALMLYDSECGWTVQELMDICRQPHHDKAVAAYFEPGSANKLRNFIVKRPRYFKFDPSTDRVSLPDHSLSMMLEECLIEFMALQIKAAKGFIDLEHVKFDDYKHILPGALIDHMRTIYAGSLQLFFSTHISSFVIYNENRVKLASEFECTSILADPDNMKLVSFFLGLLQKIGASKEKPCIVHTLTKYLHYMDDDASEFLKREYHGNLNLFFLLNRRHFRMTKPERGSVFLRAQPAVEYSIVAYLQQLLQKENAFTYSTGLSFQTLVSRGTNWWLPSARHFFASAGELGQLRLLLSAYPNIFRWQPAGNVCLRKKYSPWKEEWNSGVELLAVLYFVDVLKSIGSTSPLNPMCFNYIVLCTESAPAECKDYLDNVFPGLDIINLFHLHPNLFDFSSANCVSLKCPPAESSLHEKGSPEKLSARYAARLLRYAPKLTPDLLRICVETAPPTIGTYCKATVKERLHSVIESGLKQLRNNDAGRKTVVDDIRALYKSSAEIAQCEQATAAVQVTGDMQTEAPVPATRHSRRSRFKADQVSAEEKSGDNVAQNTLPKQAIQETALITGTTQTGGEKPVPLPRNLRRHLKAEPESTQEETDNDSTGQLLSEQEEVSPSSHIQIPSATSASFEDRVLQYITRRLQESPTHAEDVVDLVTAINRDVGPFSDYEILLCVLGNEQALGFDGKQIYSKPKP